MSNSENDEAKIIVTKTYSMKESKGNALGLEGNLSFYIIGAFVVSCLFVYVGSMEHWELNSIIIAFIMPIAISVLYLFLFHIHKPPGYQSDLISKLLVGSDFDIRKDQHKENPYIRLKEDIKNGK